MDSNEIKKYLYRNRPNANLTNFSGGYKYYISEIENFGVVTFAVPKKEAKNFEDTIPAQLLIRWLVEN